jgi:hypothetical protein
MTTYDLVITKCETLRNPICQPDFFDKLEDRVKCNDQTEVNLIIDKVGGLP